MRQRLPFMCTKLPIRDVRNPVAIGGKLDMARTKRPKKGAERYSFMLL
jgi:hypothetical protein